MRTTLDFESADTKKLLSELDFEFFLKQNIETERYNQSDVDVMYNGYKTALADIKDKARANKRQYNYYTEGQVRKMFTGGFLPALFGLDETRKHTIFRFDDIGENWAYFQYWQKYYKRKITEEKIWDYIVKIGSILAIILSIIKFFETIKHYYDTN